jgi:hypothetical protein
LGEWGFEPYVDVFVENTRRYQLNYKAVEEDHSTYEDEKNTYFCFAKILSYLTASIRSVIKGVMINVSDI